MRRRILLSLVWGLAVTASLVFLSRLAIRFFPYTDKPMMPKPFFEYALAPGMIASGAVGGGGWIEEVTFLVANAIFYAVVVFAILIVARLSKQTIRSGL